MYRLYAIGGVSGFNYDLVSGVGVVNANIDGTVTFRGATGASSAPPGYYQPRGLTPAWNVHTGRGEVDFLLGEGAGSSGGFDFLQVAVIKPISLVSYDPATGIVSLTTDRAHTIQPGGAFVITLTGTDNNGGFDVFRMSGGYTAMTGTTGTTLIYTTARALSVLTITGGTVTPNGTGGGLIKTEVGLNGSLLANDGYGNTRLGGALVHGAMQTAALSNAGTVTVNPSTSFVLIQNSTSIAAATIVLPALLAGQYAAGAELELNFQNPVGTLSWSGASVVNPPTTIAAAGQSVQFIKSGTTWQRRVSDANSSAAGGPFLPLSGGTVSSGPVNISWAQNSSSNGYFNALSKVSGSLSGVPSSGADQGFLVTQITGDTLDAPAGVVGHYITMHSGGTAASGNRIGQYIDVHYAGSTLDKTRGYSGQISGIWAYAYGEGPMGGVPGNGYGNMWGGVISGRLTSGATNWLYCIGLEVDVGVATGASASIVQGMKIVNQFNAQTPNARDYYLGLVKDQPSNPGMPNGIVFGSLDGDWPLTATGTLIGTQDSVVGGTTPKAAAWGIDWNAVAFSSGLIRGPGFTVNGAGSVGIGTVSNNAIAIAAGAASASAATIATSGTGGLQLYSNPVSFGVAGNNQLIVFPGTASTNNIGFNMSGTGAFQFRANLVLGSAGNNQALLNFGNTATDPVILNATGAGGIQLGGPVRFLSTVGFNNTAAIAKPTGWGAATGTATRTTFLTSSVTLATLAEHVKALIDDLTAYGLIGP